MKNRMRFRKLRALLLTVVLTGSFVSTAYASETEVPFGVENLKIEENDAANDDANETANDAAAIDEVKIASQLESVAAELSSLTPGEDYVDGEAVFVADSEEEAERIAEEYGGSLKSFNYGSAVIEFPESTVDAFNAAAENLSASRVVDPNYICTVFDEPNDPMASPFFDDDYYQYFHDKIHTLSANQVTSGNGVKIAVVDTGCTPNHEDSKFDSDHCQHIKSISSGTDTSVGHGIHCTGIIHETKNNSLGGYGIASGAEVYSIRIASTRSFSLDAVIEGIGMAIDDEVDVISLSVGTEDSTEALQEIVDKAYKNGITLVAAAGNDGVNVKNYPAACDHVISVAATDINDDLADYSNYGDWVDIAAPGSNVTSTYLYGTKNTISGTSSADSYGYQSGTSMATPMVAAVAALVYGANPEFTELNESVVPDEVRKILLDNTDGKVYSYEDRSVKGLVQADKAVSAAKAFTMDYKYALTDKSGIRGLNQSGVIARGKTIELKICDKNGNTKGKEMKALLKKAVWTSDKSSVLTVKNGKVKCSKKATIGSEATITATVDGSVLKFTFTVTEPLVGAGLTKKDILSGKIKVQTSIPVKVKTGEEISLEIPYLIYKNIPSISYVNLVYSKKKSRVKDNTWSIGADNTYRYAVSVPKKQINKGNVTYVTLKNGKPQTIKFNKKGKYSVKFAPQDGSGKSFTYVFKAQ